MNCVQCANTKDVQGVIVGGCVVLCSVALLLCCCVVVLLCCVLVVKGKHVVKFYRPVH